MNLDATVELPVSQVAQPPHQPIADVGAEIYRSIATDPNPFATHAYRWWLVRRVHRAVVPPGWPIGLHAHLRRMGEDPRAWPFRYTATADAAARIQECGHPVVVATVNDRRAGDGILLASQRALPPTACLEPEIHCANHAAIGQYTIDLCAAAGWRCHLEHERNIDWQCLLHRCPSRPGAWRITHLEGGQPVSHHYPCQSDGPAAVACMVGSVIANGFTRLGANRIAG